jgi:hypothetical protein
MTIRVARGGSAHVLRGLFKSRHDLECEWRGNGAEDLCNPFSAAERFPIHVTLC